MSDEVGKAVDAILSELQGFDADRSGGRKNSIKYYVRNINSQLSNWLLSIERKRKSDNAEVGAALGWLGFIGIILVVSQAAQSDIGWVKEYALVFRLWGVALCTLCVCASLERSSIVKSLWHFSVTKLLLSVVLSGVILYSRGWAASLMNSIFHVDPSALPITLNFTTAILVFKLIIPFVIVVVFLVSCLHMLAVVYWFKNRVLNDSWEFPPFRSFLLACVTVVILIFGSRWSQGELGERRLPEKIYLMAHTMDFNYSHQCSNINAAQPVVFLGQSQESVLVAPYGIEGFDFSTFFRARVNVPENFVRQKCDYRVGSQGISS